jgi:hypothetical protein
MEYVFLWSFNPWEQAIGILGMMGWELISIQHGLSVDSRYSNNIGAIAFFKRTKAEDRPVNEPLLMFPQEPERINSPYSNV